jgi:hypothetical protein
MCFYTDCLRGSERREPQEGKKAGACRPTFAIELTAGLAGAIAALWFKRREKALVNQQESVAIHFLLITA